MGPDGQGAGMCHFGHEEVGGMSSTLGTLASYMSFGAIGGGVAMKVEHTLSRAWEVLESDVRSAAGGANPFGTAVNATAAASPGVEFDDAVRCMETTKVRVSDAQKLQLYALYKQATDGDNPRQEPSQLSVVDHAKWVAWSERRGMSREAARRRYAQLACSIDPSIEMRAVS